jgi:hypothetical protein
MASKVAMDDQHNELVVGIIDYMRQVRRLAL